MPRLKRRRLGFVLFAVLAAPFLVLTPSDAHAQINTRAVTLTWTATGDDGYAGRASRYDFRYSARAITNRDTLSWWNSAAVVNMGTHPPPPSGAKDSVVIAGLANGVKYYAVLRIADQEGNWSPFSNVAVIDLTGGVTAVEEIEAGAPPMVVGAPYPSPTRGRAQISVRLARSGPLSADVFDARGRLVQSIHAGMMDAGSHVLRWDGTARSGATAAAGVYWIRVASAEITKTVKLIVVR